MDDQPLETTQTESDRDKNESNGTLERETRAAPPVDIFSASNGGAAGSSETSGEPAKIEVVLVSNDEAEGDLPRTLTDHGSSSFRWYLLAPGIAAAGAAAVLLLKFRPGQQPSGFRARLGRVSTPSFPLQGLSDAGKGIGSIAGEQMARAQTLAAQAKARAGKTPPPPTKNAWEAARDTAQEIAGDNVMTIIALAASAGLTIAARLADVKREGGLPIPQPAPKKAWYQVGPWS